MAIPNDQLHVDTPENITFNYQVAGIGSRFLAALVDTVLIVLLLAVISVCLFALGAGLQMGESWEWIAAIAGLVAFSCLWGYHIFFEMVWNGQSPGKRWAGLRVIRADGTPITLTESLVRNLVRVVDFLPAYYGVGVVAMFVDEQSRRLGDLAAGTLVVRERANVSLENLAARAVLPRAVERASAQFAWPVERLTSQDIQMAQDFLRRRFELSGRSIIAQRIARLLLEKIEAPVDPTMGMVLAEDWIMAIVAAKEQAEK